METQKIPNSQNNLEKEHSWRNLAPRLQAVFQRYNNQKSVVLAQKQMCRLTEQARTPRSKPRYLWSIHL